jgi:hypothetical protein
MVHSIPIIPILRPTHLTPHCKLHFKSLLSSYYYYYTITTTTTTVQIFRTLRINLHLKHEPIHPCGILTITHCTLVNPHARLLHMFPCIGSVNAPNAFLKRQIPYKDCADGQ